MVSIQTAVIPVSNTRPTRIKVWAGDRKAKIYSRDRWQGDDAAVHFGAVQQYVTDCGFRFGGEVVSGGTRDGYAFCFVDSDRFTIQAEK